METARGPEPGRGAEMRGALLALAASLVAGLLSIRLLPFSAPMPGYLDQAVEFSRRLRIGGTFTPEFYPAILGLALRVCGQPGIVLAQLGMYALFVLCAYGIFRLVAFAPARAAACAFLLGLAPDMLGGITKVWDIVPTSTALLALAYCLLLILRRGLSPGRGLATGAVWGLGCALRPNFLLLLLPLAYAAWLAPGPPPRRRRALPVAAILALSLGVMAGADAWAHGAPYWPANGPYNFFAGANEFTADFLRQSLNAEPSIVPALHARGLAVIPPWTDPGLRRLLVREGLSYVAHHPLRWSVGYGALKLFTMLRPDTKIHPAGSVFGLARSAVSAAALLWPLVLCRRRPAKWDDLDRFNLLLAAAYCVPFLLTNSDPRFGVSLNQYLWIPLMCAAARYRRRGTALPVSGLRAAAGRQQAPGQAP